jgi:hypothetical protein
LGGNPSITGRIGYDNGQLQADNTFSPSGNYTLALNSYPDTALAVVGGAAFAANFSLYLQPNRSLTANGSDIIAVANPGSSKNGQQHKRIYNKLQW